MAAKPRFRGHFRSVSGPPLSGCAGPNQALEHRRSNDAGSQGLSAATCREIRQVASGMALRQGGSNPLA